MYQEIKSGLKLHLLEVIENDYCVFEIVDPSVKGRLVCHASCVIPYREIV